VRGLEKVFLSVIVNAMSDMEVEVIASKPLSAKRKSEFLENYIKKLQDRHKICRSAIGNSSK
jgi:hypothetical protein